MSILSQGPKEAEISPSLTDEPTPDEPTAEEYQAALTTLARAFRHKYPTEFTQALAQLASHSDGAKETTTKEDPLLKFAGDWKDRPELLKAIAETRHYYNNRPLEDEETDSASI